MTVTIRLEHPVLDYDAWKAAFDRDPLGREVSGVLAYRVLRPVDDPKHIAVVLDFADLSTAQRFRDALLGLWATSQAQALIHDPLVRIEEVVEAHGLVD